MDKSMIKNKNVNKRVDFTLFFHMIEIDTIISKFETSAFQFQAAIIP